MAELAEIVDFKTDSAATSAGSVYEKLRDGLIWGQWPPGTKLKPQHLKEAFSTTASALREALIRLAGEGFVDFEEQRGFSTMRPSRQSFQQLRHLRVLLEKEGARLSITNGDLEWETNLAAAHHSLSYLEAKMKASDDLSGYIKMWSRMDAQFHKALIAACGSELLIQEYRSIYDKYRLHAVVELRTFGFRGEITIAEHATIFDAATARDVSACQKAIEDHVTIYRSQSASDLNGTGAR